MVLVNGFAPWFRTEFQKDGKLRILKSKIDEYQILYDIGKPLYRSVYRTEVRMEEYEFLDAKFLYEALLNTQEEYKIRVEKWHSFNIYSNNIDFLNNLVNNLEKSAIELWTPKESNINYLLDEQNIILVNTPPTLEYKVTLKANRVDANFANWLKNNSDKCKVGKQTLANISQGWGGGSYFYVRDIKVLSMIEIIISNSIQRVERLVYQPTIDK